MGKDKEVVKSPPPASSPPPAKQTEKKSGPNPPAKVETPVTPTTAPASNPAPPVKQPNAKPAAPTTTKAPPQKAPPAPPPPSNSKQAKGKVAGPTSIEVLVPPPTRDGNRQKMKIGDTVVEMEDVVTQEKVPSITAVKRADCYCEPNQWCCFKRCMKLGTMVGFVGFFDAGLYMMLSCVCGFVLLMWESTGKYVEARGLTTKYEWWEKFMIPNEDGIYLLLAAYVVSAFAGWNLGLRFKKMKRCPAVWWLMSNIYTTGLQFVSMIFFPFQANMYNLVPIAIRVYQYWIVWSWDMFLKARNEKLDDGEQCPQLAMELKEDTEVKVSKTIPPPHRHHRK